MNEIAINTRSAAVDEVSYLDEFASEYAKDPDYIAEGMALEFAEAASRKMKAEGISRAKLARQMGVSRAYITRIFDAPPNLTLLSIAKLALALGLTPEIRLGASGGPDSADPAVSSHKP